MDTVFFILSKLLIVVFLVESWLLFGLVLTLIGVIFKRQRLAVSAGAATMAAFIFVGVFPLGAALIRSLEEAYPPLVQTPALDGIVVLGGWELPGGTAFWEQPQTNTAAERIIAGATLALQHSEARIVVTGGNGILTDGIDGTETENVARRVLTSLGIAEDRIVWENQSRNTAENVEFSYDLVSPNPNETWALVTSAFHMGRAMESFEAVGWDRLIAYPVDYRSAGSWVPFDRTPAQRMHTTNVALKEWVGRFVYRVTGR